MAGADLDKQSINYASVFGMNTDLHLTGQDYSRVVLCSILDRWPGRLFLPISSVAFTL